MSLERVKDGRIGIAEFEHHLAFVRHDIGRAGAKDDAADIPDRVRPAQARKLLRDLRGQPHQRGTRVPAIRHGVVPA